MPSKAKMVNIYLLFSHAPTLDTNFAQIENTRSLATELGLIIFKALHKKSIFFSVSIAFFCHNYILPFSSIIYLF